MSDPRAEALAAVERSHAQLAADAAHLESFGEPWAGAITQSVGRTAFEINWFRKERERRAADAAEREKEQQR